MMNVIKIRDKLYTINYGLFIINYFGFKYDIYGNVSKLTYPDKSEVLYTYDTPSIGKLDEIIKENDSVILCYLYKWGGHYIETHYDKNTNSYVIVNEYNLSNKNNDNMNSISNHLEDNYANNSIFITATIINGGK